MSLKQGISRQLQMHLHLGSGPELLVGGGKLAWMGFRCESQHKKWNQVEYYQNYPPKSFRETTGRPVSLSFTQHSNPSLFVWGALNTVVGLQLDLGQETDLSWTSESYAVSHHRKRLQHLGDQRNNTQYLNAWVFVSISLSLSVVEYY